MQLWSHGKVMGKSRGEPTYCFELSSKLITTFKVHKSQQIIYAALQYFCDIMIFPDSSMTLCSNIEVNFNHDIYNKCIMSINS